MIDRMNSMIRAAMKVLESGHAWVWENKEAHVFGLGENYSLSRFFLIFHSIRRL